MLSQSLRLGDVICSFLLPEDHFSNFPPSLTYLSLPADELPRCAFFPPSGFMDSMTLPFNRLRIAILGKTYLEPFSYGLLALSPNADLPFFSPFNFRNLPLIFFFCRQRRQPHR